MISFSQQKKFFEFWFRKEYKQDILNKNLTSFVRPGVRVYPAPKGTSVGDTTNIRILDVPGTSSSEPIFNPYTTKAIVKEIKIKKIGDMDFTDFEGATEDASSAEKVISQLERIYGESFTKNDIVTIFKISYLISDYKNPILVCYLDAMDFSKPNRDGVLDRR